MKRSTAYCAIKSVLPLVPIERASDQIIAEIGH
jgi:hypothetical protein